MNVLRRLFRAIAMDSEENYLYYSHQKLLSLIARGSSKDASIREYLSTVKYAPIKDFKTGLEWFNVSEPLFFNKHLKGKIVLLDFFTYCCINCMHIIPELREIESKFSIEDGLVVIGVHSAKFENEKSSSNILSAVQRYNIGHPVVNDNNSDMWQNCDVDCWPTLLLLGPNADPILMLTGEGHKNELSDYIRVTLDFYKEKGLISHHKLPLKSAFHLLPNSKGPLLFPGKVAIFVEEDGSEILGISDTGNNRILITDNRGKILTVVGGQKLGFKDGTLEQAEFNNPQGLAFQNRNVLFVADTENHAIRRIDLSKDRVETVAGTGEQGHDRSGGRPGPEQPISSPWDVAVYRTADMDMTFYNSDQPRPLKDVVIVAMAGTHQIWALFLEDTVWWKCKKYAKGACACIAGSGREENRNNSYPQSAAFAQPSGLALSAKNKEIYVADSESSSVRRLSLVDGKVTPVVGGDRNPNNLFAFGDKDGTLFEAKLQHALGVGINPDQSALFVTDTYNHKLKKVDVIENKIVTLQLNNAVEPFKEPAGLCVSADGKRIFVADTNNHQIRVLTLGRNNNVNSAERLELSYQKSKTSTVRAQPRNAQILQAKPIDLSSNGGKLVLKFDLQFAAGLKLTADAPQHWSVELPDPIYSCVPKNGADVKSVDLVINVPSNSSENRSSVDVDFNLVCCVGDVCLPKRFAVKLPLDLTENGPEAVERKVSVILDEKTVKIGE